VKSASSNSNKGPVVPTINNGCPENSEKMTPDTDVATRVSDIPMKFFVLSAEQLQENVSMFRNDNDFPLNRRGSSVC